MNILYFAWLRERIGISQEQVDPPADVDDIDALLDWLAPRSPGHAAAFADRSRLRAAIDQIYVTLGAPIAGAREIALFPPVTGG